MSKKIESKKKEKVMKEPLARIINIVNREGKISTESYNFIGDNTITGIQDYLATLVSVLTNACMNAGITKEQLIDVISIDYDNTIKAAEEDKKKNKEEK